MRNAMQWTMSGRSARTIARCAEKPRTRFKNAETAPFAFERHDPATFSLDAGGVVAHARRDHNLEAGRAGGPGHGEEMGDEKPVFGDQIKKFGHPRSADRQRPALA